MENNKDKIRKSKKEHFCYLCGGMIAKGESYVDKVTFMYGFTKSKTHISCDNVFAFSEAVDKEDFINIVQIEHNKRKDIPEAFRHIKTSFKSKVDYFAQEKNY